MDGSDRATADNGGEW